MRWRRSVLSPKYRLRASLRSRRWKLLGPEARPALASETRPNRTRLTRHSRENSLFRTRPGPVVLCSLKERRDRHLAVIRPPIASATRRLYRIPTISRGLSGCPSSLSIGATKLSACTSSLAIRGDRALGPDDVDKLGFSGVARRLATSLVDDASNDGLVIGIDGKWGSGKSSLLFMVEQELATLPPGKAPSIVRFKPWLVGQRDALITSLFNDISAELDQLALGKGDATRLTVTRAKVAAEAMRSFMSGVSRAGQAIEVVGDASGQTWIKWLGKLLSSLDKVCSKREPTTLSDRKEKLIAALRDLGRRIVVTIDDVDRLEPAEVIEILRLVRSVVDLPTIIYLLCYDSDVLAQGLETAAGINDGHAYLEKIVQVSTMVPKPEALHLQHWLADELEKIASVTDQDQRQRLRTVIAYEGARQLQTPRAVVRTLDAVRFLWPPLRDAGADLADLVWLQLIKGGNPRLYRWVEQYCTEAALISLENGRIAQEELRARTAELLATVPEGCFAATMYRHYFAAQLPGLAQTHRSDGDPFVLHRHVEARDRDAAIRGKRLASPDHYRLYFALGGPAHLLLESEVAAFIAAARESADATIEVLKQFHAQAASGSLTKGDLLLARLSAGIYGDLDAGMSANLLLAFANGMDELYPARPSHFGLSNTMFERAQDMLPVLLADQPDRMVVVMNMFGNGKALDWLTDVFRRETFDHGRVDRGRAKSVEVRLLHEEELDLVTDRMLARYRPLGWDAIVACADPVSILFAWKQGGEPEGPSNMLAPLLETDEAMLATLGMLVDENAPNLAARREVLRFRNLSAFVDMPPLLQRLTALQQVPQSSAVAQRLIEIIQSR
ncbi:P-loop NTPase fold protein [Novosphingobium aerophilum]|uniref:KAP family P-loop NTPase fold protein n=1 Tax=Novosphingobium aerophilum TaxID=2839843 RepID=UPI003FD63621